MSAHSITGSAGRERSRTSDESSKSAPRELTGMEILLVGLLALAIDTTLLLRMPYRHPVANSVYSVSALSAFYFYLRMRLDIKVPPQMLLCLVIPIILDIVGNQFGLFSRRIALIPYDTITHFSTCALLLVIVMWLLTQLAERFGYRLPGGLIAFFSVTTTFSLGGYYEITELLDERLLGGHRIWSTRDTVQDLAADLAGAVVAAICYALVLNKKSSRYERHS